MGDHVDVTLDLLKSEYDRALAEGIDIEGDYVVSYEYPSDGQLLIMMESVFEGCNYADIGIETALQEAKIPYDKQWEQGGNYAEGVEYFRILKGGQAVTKEFYGEEETHIPFQDLLEARKGGLKGVDAFIDKELARREILSWPEQVKILKKLRNAAGSAADLNTD
ncbi:MAG: hypothetical protein RBR35_17665 [Salinivirgaceae bacterium]|nr:hypothetical protein [Salinivirgaceae bacterium]